MRTIRNLVPMVDGPFASGTTDNTITCNLIVTPAAGARIHTWGVTYTAAGTGALDPVVSLVEAGLQDTTGAYGNRLANTITLDLDGTANSQTSATGPAVEVGSAGRALTQGERLQARVNFTAAADTFATTDASFVIWTLWQM